MMPILFIIIAIILILLLVRFNMRSASKDAIKQAEVEQQTAAAQDTKEQEMIVELTDSPSPAEKKKADSVIMEIHTDENMIDDDYRQALIQFQNGRAAKDTTKEESKDKMDDNQYRNAMLSIKKQTKK